VYKYLNIFVILSIQKASVIVKGSRVTLAIYYNFWIIDYIYSMNINYTSHAQFPWTPNTNFKGTLRLQGSVTKLKNSWYQDIPWRDNEIKHGLFANTKFIHNNDRSELAGQLKLPLQV
jgi:hypothetical protein